jgi:hypothetical protein
MQHYLWLVEGPHDIEFTGRLLAHMGYSRLRRKSDVDRFWYNAIPTKFPFADDLEERMPTPVFYRLDSRMVAIKTAVGVERLANEAAETIKVIGETPAAVAFFLDADSKLAVDQYDTLTTNVMRKANLALSPKPGEIIAGPPRCGAYVFPDNNTPGTLGDILSQCADVSYRGLMYQSRKLVGDVNRNELTQTELVGLSKPAGVTKAALCCAATILKPAQTIQASIRSDRWVKGDALNLPIVNSVYQFIADILD